jgi:hypothetical protein
VEALTGLLDRGGDGECGVELDNRGGIEGSGRADGCPRTWHGGSTRRDMQWKIATGATKKKVAGGMLR